MKMKQAKIITYSPTGTTARNLLAIAAGMGFSKPEMVNVTLQHDDEAHQVVSSDVIALIGAPVYGGRVAPHAASRLKAFSGNGTPAIVTVVYGNRAYENALKELKCLAEEAGFVVIGCAAMIGQHSFSSDEKPIAHGRPDAADLQAAHQFGAAIKERMGTDVEMKSIGDNAVPGEVPEDLYAGRSGASPDVDVANCAGCGICVERCPVGLISLVDSVACIDNSSCTFCCACVQSCPSGAMKVSFPPIVQATDWLHANCQKRLEPEFYL